MQRFRASSHIWLDVTVSQGVNFSRQVSRRNRRDEPREAALGLPSLCVKTAA
jgi:hypothetical protein